MDQHINNIFKLTTKLSELGIQLKKMNNMNLDESIKNELYQLSSMYDFISDLDCRLAKLEAIHKECEAHSINYDDMHNAKALPEPINRHGVSEDLYYAIASRAMPEPISEYGVSEELIRIDDFDEFEEKCAMAMPEPINNYGISEELLYEDYIPELIYNFDSTIKNTDFEE